MLKQWEEAVKQQIKNPSRALTDITAALQAFELDRCPKRLQDLALALELWRTTGPLYERAEMAPRAKDLELFIVNQRLSNVVIQKTAMNLGQSKLWTLSPTPQVTIANWRGPIDPQNMLAPMGPKEVQMLNEAFERAHHAVTNAREKLRQLAPKLLPGSKAPASKPSDTPVLQNYIRWFGAWDHAAFTLVLSNFELMCCGFDQPVVVHDCRNTLDGPLYYGACPAQRIDPHANNQAVVVQVGRLLFEHAQPLFRKVINGTSFEDQRVSVTSHTSNMGLGTLLHELAHGTFNAVDAPPVLTEKPPKLATGYNQDPSDVWYGHGDDAANQQSSTVEADEALARAFPQLAIRNADNYSQFARTLLEL